MIRQWQTNLQDYDKGKAEQLFLDKLALNGYKVEGFKVYQSKTIYLISKDNHSIEFNVYHTKFTTKKNNGRQLYDQFELLFILSQKTGL